MRGNNQEKQYLGLLGKLLLTLLPVMAIFLIIVVGTTQVSTRSTLEKNAIENGLLTTSNRAAFMEANLAQIQKLSDNLYSNVDVYNLLRQEQLDSMQNYRINLFMRSLMAMSSEINLYQIYLDNYISGDSFLIGQTGSSYGPSRYHVGIPKSVNRAQVYCEGPHLASAYGFSLGTQVALVHSFHWRIYDSAQRHIIGTITFDVTLSEMTDLTFPLENEIGFVWQEDGAGEGTMVFSKGINLTNQEVQGILESCRDSGWTRFQKGKISGIAFEKTAALNNLKWHLVCISPYSEIFESSDRLLKRNTKTLVIEFALMGILMAIFVRTLVRPLKKVDQCFQEIKNRGDLSYRVSEHVGYRGHDEVARLIAETDRMLERIEELFNRQQLLAKAQRDAAAKMLQAQINPHFLYNSLQSLASLALQRGEKDIFQYITMLGSRMHYSMDMEQTSALLQQEFEYVESYLVLQNVRFGNGLQSEIQLSPEAAEVMVPRMILQPLAENAFKHGKICRKNGSYIRMKAEIQDGLLHILMENNGNPCSAERIEQINEELAIPGVQEYSRREHIGLISVLYRLRLFFCDEVSMVLIPLTEGGLQVHIRIPLKE